jgi:hypothetical protein
MAVRRFHRAHRFFDSRRNSVACLYPYLCTVLVEWFQPVSEHHRDNGLVGYSRSTNRLDVGYMGNQTL